MDFNISFKFYTPFRIQTTTSAKRRTCSAGSNIKPLQAKCKWKTTAISPNKVRTGSEERVKEREREWESKSEIGRKEQKSGREMVSEQHLREMIVNTFLGV